ncbi:ABC transporter substrate-binding protein [Kitasatospora azatica]|uniref:ABC transporter substrate-binding protein n=1 Tax=Kitasatospora azatica TaxID=58347 RepID=UPI000A0555EF|nr:ABC transporter substrate-binding protein [Kitasatospora azatica]
MSNRPAAQSPLSRRTLAGALAGGTLLAGGAGALAWRVLAGGAEPAGDPNGTGPVTLATGKDTTGYLRGVLADWNAAHPAEPAELVELPEAADEVHAQLAGELGRGDSRFDVLNLDVVWTAEFAARRWIAPLDEARFPLDRFLPPVLSAGRFAGRLYAVPYVANAAMLYYRSDILAAAGQQPPTSWAELARQASTLAPAAGLAGYAGQFKPYEGLTVNALEAVRSAGGDLLDGSGAVVVDSARARAGLEFLAGGLRAGWIPQAALEYQEEESRQAFQDGHLLFLRNWPYVYPAAQGPGSAVTGRFGVVPLPGPDGPGSGVLGGSGLAVSRFSRRQRTARALIAELTGRQVQRRVLAEGGLPPVWADLYQDPELVARFPYLPVLRSAILAAGARPGIPQYQQLSLAVSEASYEILRGRRTAADGLARLAADLRDIVR